MSLKNLAASLQAISDNPCCKGTDDHEPTCPLVRDDSYYASYNPRTGQWDNIA